MFHESLEVRTKELEAALSKVGLLGVLLMEVRLTLVWMQMQ